MTRRCWIEIRRDILLNNYRIYRSQLREGQRVMAVVKADAYGHGAAEAARTLQAEGCTDFAVSNIDEAAELRETGITGQILILGYTPPEEAERLVRYDITQALLDEEYAESLADRGVRAQFALDTGMNRVGLDADDPAYCEEVIRAYADRFTLTGLFTHLCVADTPSETQFTNRQIDRFFAVAERVADLQLPEIHCLNSAGGLWHNRGGTLARLGIILYGLKPDAANTLPAGIRPVLTWKSVVSLVKTVRPGETVGYGRAYRAETARRIATVSAGYADGYSRTLSGKGTVFIHGKPAPIVGRICMDQMTVDVTGIPSVRPGDEAILLGNGYTADDMARQTGTIGYEVLCNIGQRVPHVWLDGETEGKA